MTVYDSPVGRLVIAEDGEGITDIFPEEASNERFCAEVCETDLLRECKRQLGEYFSGGRREFSLPLSLHGTEFQRRDWEALRAIPYGETRSYQDIAEMLGNPRACRAVGMANHRNPVMIVVPCHRVIGKNGALVGYGGGLSVKEFLLHLERGEL